MIFDIIKLIMNPPKISKDIYVIKEGDFGIKSEPLKTRYFKMSENLRELNIIKNAAKETN